MGKLTRYTLLVIVNLLFVLYIIPLIGAGPVWNNYA
jgi:hypothetical protein